MGQGQGMSCSGFGPKRSPMNDGEAIKGSSTRRETLGGGTAGRPASDRLPCPCQARRAVWLQQDIGGWEQSESARLFFADYESPSLIMVAGQLVSGTWNELREVRLDYEIADELVPRPGLTCAVHVPVGR